MNIKVIVTMFGHDVKLPYSQALPGGLIKVLHLIAGRRPEAPVSFGASVRAVP